MNIPTNTVLLELHIPDFNKAKEFYSNLGFKVVWERKPEGKKGYLVIKRGSNILCFWPGNEEVWNQEYFCLFSKDTKRGYGVEIVILVDDIEILYKQVEKFAKVVEELKIKPWGLKDFRIEDPFGYYLRFSEPYDVLDKKNAVK